MKNLTEDHAYSMEEGFLYLPGSDLDRLNTRRISTDKVEKLLKKIGIDSSIYNILSKSFYDDDIMRWSSMLTIAALSLKEACIQGDGYTIEIVEQGTYYDNYTIYVNGTICFQLHNTWSSDNIDYKIAYINLGYLDSTILNDFDDDSIMDALFSPRGIRPRTYRA